MFCFLLNPVELNATIVCEQAPQLLSKVRASIHHASSESAPTFADVPYMPVYAISGSSRIHCALFLR